jgi:Tol biopolymer transport system component
MKADGSGVRQLTYLQNADGAALQASWSADGTQIVFRERPSDTTNLTRGLYLMNADGSNQHVLYTDPSNGVFSPSFSPDGTHVAFALCPDGVSACAIDTIKTDGTGLSAVTRLNAKGEVFDFSPQYSPDGRTIAFAGFNRPEPDSVAVYLVNTNGGAVRQITDTGFGASDPDWSPDGSHLVVTSEEAIWSMKADGTGLTKLSSPARSHDGLARWSPDGTRIVFERDSPNFANFYVVTMNANGSSPMVVSSGATTADSVQPDWGTAP